MSAAQTDAPASARALDELCSVYWYPLYAFVRRHVSSADDAADLSDRVYQVRCAAEDVATALDEGAGATELRELCDVLIRAARAADGWRRAGV